MAATPHFASQARVALKGSEKKSILGAPIAHAVSATAPAPVDTTPITVSVIVRRKSEIDKSKLGTAEGRMTREEFAANHGPAEDSIALVQAFAAEFGLSVALPNESGRRTLHLTGTQQQMEAAFGVALSHLALNGETYRVRGGTIYLPEELIGHVEAVLGLDNRPQAKPHFRVRPEKKKHPVPPPAPKPTPPPPPPPPANNGSFTPVQVGQLYGFPANATAASETIGIIELGGGFKQADITAYFAALGQTPPNVIAVLVDGGKNAPTNANSADGEVMLDIEVCAAVAPGAKIVVYFTPNTDQGFTDAIATAVHDSTNKPSVLSISRGRAGVVVDRAGDDRARQCLPGSCRAGCDHYGRFR